MKHLHCIRGRWAVRIAVPKRLQEIVGRKELREWLGTDKRAAERRAPEVIGRFYAVLDEAQARLETDKPTLHAAARHHYEHELLADDRERAVSSGTVAELNAWSGPILTTAEEVGTWLTAPTNEALPLQRPLPDGALKIVAKGQREDGTHRTPN